MERQRDTGARIETLVRGADWALTGTSGVVGVETLPVLETKEGS
jgi:hypothetical protein